MKKRWILAAVLALALCVVCLALLPNEAQAATKLASGTCGDNLTWVLTSDGVLTISGEGAIKSSPWKDYALQIKTVIIGNGITAIGRSAFSGCKIIKEVTFPDSLKKIDVFAFYSCASLLNVTIPSNCEVDEYAFTYCTALKEATVYGKLKGYRNFEGCTALETVFLGDNCTHIPGYAFADCSKLKTVSIPATLTSIGDSAFEGCIALQSIAIPSGVTSIGSWAFFGCRGIKEVHIANLAAWCNINFGGTSIFNPDPAGSNPLASGDGKLFLNGELVEHLEIPDTVSVIKNHAFAGYTYLKSLVIPAGTDVESEAFLSCCNLETVVISEGTTVLAAGLFQYCTKLKEITLPVSLLLIDKNAFDMYGPIGFGERPQIIETVHYAGTTEQWNNIVILTGNEQISVAYQRTTCPHNWASTGIKKEETCSEAGREKFTCVTCGATKTDEIPAKGHTAVVDAAIAATCTKTGLTEGKHCSVCEEVIEAQNEVPATGHKPGAEATCTSTQVCKVCNTVINTAIGHNYTRKTTKPTCTELGYTTHTCFECGDSYVDDYVDAIGHVYGDWTQAKAPTTEETGLEERVCTNCGDTEQHEIAKLDPKPTEPKPTEPAPTEPSTPAPTTTPPGAEPSATTPTGNQTPGDNGNPTVVIIAIVAIVAAGGAAALIILKKKK